MTKIRRFIALLIGFIALTALVIIIFYRQYRAYPLFPAYSTPIVASDVVSLEATVLVPYPSPITQSSLSLTATSSSQFYPPPPTPLPPQPAQPPPPPLCQFKSDIASGTQEVSDMKYYFSEPHIVRESSQNIEIIEWLPDNHWVLITQEENPLQNIELFDPKTKEIQNLATRRSVFTAPIWLSTLDAVLYVEMKILDYAKQPVIFKRQLSMSNKDTGQVDKITEEISSLSIAADSKSNRYAYLGAKQLISRYPMSGSTQAVAINSLQWLFPADPSHEQYLDPIYNLAWRPGTSQIAFNSNKGLFLVDADTGNSCKLDRIGWPLVARWNLDGRYLAMVWALGDLQHNPSELVVLDMETGKTYSNPVVPDVNGERYITDIAWAPDNRHLIVVGEYYPDLDFAKRNGGIYLVDIHQGSSIAIESTIHFGGGGLGTNIAWSPDGTKLIIACPTEKVDRLCLIDVQQKASP